MRFSKTKQFKAVCFSLIFSFLTNSLIQAAPLNLPNPQQFIPLSSAYSFPVLKGLKFDPANPLKMEFIVDTGDKKDISPEEAGLLIKYFLAGLTTPEKDIWVNLSPYEQDRIIPESLSQTDLGKDLLSQDYLLKQLMASLTYPESDTGKDYWDKTYSEVLKIAKTTKLPVNTFNKVWITPDEAEIYESDNAGLITKAKLKVMLEEDYLALKNKQQAPDFQKESKKYGMGEDLVQEVHQSASKVMKEVILPKINSEINSGKNFATLRQIYYSLILGLWFKQKFQDSIYQHYINQGKIKGIDLEDKTVKEKIYQQYVAAFKTGLYNYIKTDQEPATHKKIRRRYYSGGFAFGDNPYERIRFVKVPEGATDGATNIPWSSAIEGQRKRIEVKFSDSSFVSDRFPAPEVISSRLPVATANSPLVQGPNKKTAVSPIMVSASDGKVYLIPEKFKGVFFGTSGHRGKRGEQMNEGVAASITQAIADFINAQEEFKDKVKILILGGDPRPKNKAYLEEEARVAIANGLKVYVFEEPMPTPIASFAVRFADKFINMGKNAVVVGTINNTPSHNPSDDDGIKFNPGGVLQGPPSGPEVNSFVQTAANAIIKNGRGIKRLSDSKSLTEHPNYIKANPEKVVKAYIDRVSKMIDFKLIRNAVSEKGLKWPFNVQNGAGGWWAEKIFGAVDKDLLILLYGEPKSDFGGLPLGPNTEKWEQLEPLIGPVIVKNNTPGAGATDGDADRFYFADEKGNSINFNIVLALMYAYVRRVKGIEGAFKTCVDGTSMFEKIGPVLTRTKIGFKDFQDSLRNEEVSIAAEAGSGGMTLGKAMDPEGIGHVLDKDGFIAQLLFLEMTADAVLKGKKISDLINELYERYGFHIMAKTASLRIVSADLEIVEKTKKEVMRELLETYKIGMDFNGDKILNIDRMDGIKLFLKNPQGYTYWVLIRPSGTGPEMRAYGEVDAPNGKTRQEAVKAAEDIFNKRDRFVKDLISKTVKKLSTTSIALSLKLIPPQNTALADMVSDAKVSEFTKSKIFNLEESLVKAGMELDPEAFGQALLSGPRATRHGEPMQKALQRLDKFYQRHFGERPQDFKGEVEIAGIGIGGQMDVTYAIVGTIRNSSQRNSLLLASLGKDYNAIEERWIKFLREGHNPRLFWVVGSKSGTTPETMINFQETAKTMLRVWARKLYEDEKGKALADELINKLYDGKPLYEKKLSALNLSIEEKKVLKKVFSALIVATGDEESGSLLAKLINKSFINELYEQEDEKVVRIDLPANLGGRKQSIGPNAAAYAPGLGVDILKMLKASREVAQEIARAQQEGRMHLSQELAIKLLLSEAKQFIIVHPNDSIFSNITGALEQIIPESTGKGRKEDSPVGMQTYSFNKDDINNSAFVKDIKGEGRVYFVIDVEGQKPIELAEDIQKNNWVIRFTLKEISEGELSKLFQFVEEVTMRYGFFNVAQALLRTLEDKALNKANLSYKDIELPKVILGPQDNDPQDELYKKLHEIYKDFSPDRQPNVEKAKKITKKAAERLFNINPEPAFDENGLPIREERRRENFYSKYKNVAADAGVGLLTKSLGLTNEQSEYVTGRDAEEVLFEQIDTLKIGPRQGLLNTYSIRNLLEELEKLQKEMSLSGVPRNSFENVDKLVERERGLFAKIKEIASDGNLTETLDDIAQQMAALAIKAHNEGKALDFVLYEDRTPILEAFARFTKYLGTDKFNFGTIEQHKSFELSAGGVDVSFMVLINSAKTLANLKEKQRPISYDGLVGKEMAGLYPSEVNALNLEAYIEEFQKVKTGVATLMTKDVTDQENLIGLILLFTRMMEIVHQTAASSAIAALSQEKIVKDLKQAGVNVLTTKEGTVVYRISSPEGLPEEVKRYWDEHEALYVLENPKIGYRAYAAVHAYFGDPQRAIGGTRVILYKSVEETIADLLNLSKAMSKKNALAGLDDIAGGAKVGINEAELFAGITSEQERKEKKQAALDSLALALQELGVGIITSTDSGTTPDNIKGMAKRAPKVIAGAGPDIGLGGELTSPATATGVFNGIKAAVKFASENIADFGSSELTGKTVSLQGLGGVGSILLGKLLEAGAIVHATEEKLEVIFRIEQDYRDWISKERLFILKNPDDIYKIQAQIFCPCALGGILNEKNITLLREAGVKIIAGAANNQLKEPSEDSQRLHENKILYVSDYVINAGGVIAALVAIGRYNLDEKLENIGKTVKYILEEAFEQKVSPAIVADTMADKIIAEKRVQGPAASSAISAELNISTVTPSKRMAGGAETLRVDVELNGGAKGHIVVPAGTSAGVDEAPTVGVQKAIENIGKIHNEITKRGLKADQLTEIAQVMLEMGKDNLGAEATLGYQMALAWAVARQKRLEGLYKLIREIAPDLASKGIPKTKMMDNITNGGAHAKNSLDIQEFMTDSVAKTTSGENRMNDEEDRALGFLYQQLGLKADPDDKGIGEMRGKEGGYKIDGLTLERLREIYNNAEKYKINNLDLVALRDAKAGIHEFVLNCLIAAIRNAGYTPSTSREIETVGLSLDSAATSMLVDENNPGFYRFEGRQISSKELVEIYASWVKKYPIVSIEDGLSENDWEGWMYLIEKLGDKVLLIGDDLLVTQGKRLMELISRLEAKGFIDKETGKVTKKLGILIKLNQNGFLTTGINDPAQGYLGTLEVIRLARKYGFEIIVSHRSKEAESEENEVSIADLAAGVNALFLKSGDHVQGIRAVKKDRLAEIDARERKEAERKAAATVARDVFNLWRRSYDVPPPPDEKGFSESSEDVHKKRILPFNKEIIIPSIRKGHNLLISAHGNSLRTLSMELFGLTADEIKDFTFPLATLLRIRFDVDGKVTGVLIVESSKRASPDPKNVQALADLLRKKGIQLKIVQLPTDKEEIKTLIKEGVTVGMGELFLIRHGQTVSSDTLPGGGYFAGQLDVELTEQGKEDARESGRVLKELFSITDIKINAAYTSDLKRAQNTLNEVLSAAGISDAVPVTIDPRLKERHYGALQGKNREKFMAELEGLIVKLWNQKPELRLGDSRTIAKELSENWHQLTSSPIAYSLKSVRVKRSGSSTSDSALGGIDLEDIVERTKVKAGHSLSSPLPKIDGDSPAYPLIPADFPNWPGLFFKIVRIEDIEDLEKMFTAPLYVKAEPL